MTVEEVANDKGFKKDLRISVVTLLRDIQACEGSNNPEKCRKMLLNQILETRVRICLFLGYVKPENRKELCQALKKSGMTIKDGRRKLLPHLWKFYLKKSDSVEENAESALKILSKRRSRKKFLSSL